jgi:hypothetical protein
VILCLPDESDPTEEMCVTGSISRSSMRPSRDPTTRGQKLSRYFSETDGQAESKRSAEDVPWGG